MSTNETLFKHIQVKDEFWSKYQDLVNNVVIPYQWNALNDELPDTEPSHAIENFKIAAGLSDGEFYGMVFQDSDVAKWLEAVAYSLVKTHDSELEEIADNVIDLIGKSQLSNGYLNTYFTVKEPDAKWTNLCECHELYCAGHLIEAGVAYYQATEKRSLLDIVCRFADHISDVFGDDPEKLKGYPGHPEIELALMRLYEVVPEQRYLDLCQYFVEERGKQPHYFDLEYEKRGKTSFWDVHGVAWMVKDKAYSQAHLPLDEQTVAIGHAVRFIYLVAGVAHLARITKDQEKLTTCQRLWNNVIQKQLYVTGAIGSQSEGESFSSDYDLPNDTAYTETCASIGLMMFANRMLQLDSNSQYADVMERALYNTVLAGMALDGKHFFYVNPLEVTPEAIKHNHIYDHVKPVRQKWFGCACCPPNIARILGSIGNYIYTVKNNTVLINLYIGNNSEIELDNGSLSLTISDNFTWEGNVSLTVSNEAPIQAQLGLRIPDWCDNPMLTVNGAPINIQDKLANGYVLIDALWQNGDKLNLELPMDVKIVRANPHLRHNVGKIALQRGPFVYCLEQADNGEDLHNLQINSVAEITNTAGEGVLANYCLLKAQGKRVSPPSSSDSLYSFNAPAPELKNTELTFIPYFSWANRGEGEMRVWVNEA